MRHEWMFEVLRDLKAYALANGLPAVAAKAEETLQAARAEVALTSLPGDPEAGPGPAGGLPPRGLPH